MSRDPGLKVGILLLLSVCRIDTGLAPGRKRAYLLYKAAMKEAAVSPAESEGATDGPAVAAPHPYMLALGVLSIQKVGV